MSSSPDVRAWAPRTVPVDSTQARAWTPVALDEGPVAVDPERSAPWLLPEVRSIAPRRRLQQAPAPADAADLAEERRRAYAEGFHAGLGRKADEVNAAIHALSGVTRALAAGKAAILKDVEANLAAVALAAARHLVGREVAGDPSILHELVTRGLSLVRPDKPVTVRLHPEDLEDVQATLESTLVLEPGSVRWTADPSVDRGGFVIESPQKVVDGRVDEALRLLYERLVYE